MDKETKSALSEFSRRAIQRLRDKKTIKKRRLNIPSIDQDITIRNLSYGEVVECTEIEDNGDPNRSDKYAVYLAVTEPNLREVATQLKAAGEIKEFLEVVDIFDLTEITQIATQVMKISGVIGDKKVTVVDEIKN